MRHYTCIYILGIAISTLIFASCNKQKERSTTTLDKYDIAKTLPNTHTILSQLQQSADIVTTDVRIRKIAVYDSSKSEHFSWTSPSTWKYGERMCIIPIEVHIKYGYDLRDLTIEDIKLTDDSTAVIIHLPEAKIIDAGYNAEIDRSSVTSISTGLRTKIGHELEEEIRRKGYEAVLKEDLTEAVGKDVERNTKALFETIIKNLGWEYVQVITTDKR